MKVLLDYLFYVYILIFYINISLIILSLDIHSLLLVNQVWFTLSSERFPIEKNV